MSTKTKKTKKAEALSFPIFLAVRVETMRKTVADVKAGCWMVDIEARDQIAAALKRAGFKIVATGEGRYANLWVRK